MRTQVLIFFSAISFFLGVIFLPTAQSSPSNFFDDEDSSSDEYNDLDNDLERILYLAVKRDNNAPHCIGRGGSCDNRSSDCCEFTSCRCNLWGANCRCQRRGLFQKWGK
ncbi:xibalbin-1-like [Lycorma delicatula]|uniref:xibalbin-1-like n=1 Tax=Lycorma delicatula TaxID=130591 RepID=UPI003F50E38D